MPPSLAALFTAIVVAVAAAAQPAGETSAAAPPAAAGGSTSSEPPAQVEVLRTPFGTVVDELLLPGRGPLPPAPKDIVRDTLYYGTVTFNHAAHVSRRTSCETCHGPGRVTKLHFTPKDAHTRCRGCHVEQAKGPTSCQACHVRPPPPPSQLATAAPPAPPPGPNAANVAAALAAFASPDRSGKEPLQRQIELGLSGGRGLGLSIRHVSHQDFFLLSESVEMLRAATDARTLVLVGGGLSRPINSGTSLEASALVGFDVFDRPVVALFPAVGARAAIEWRQPTPFLQHVTASLTCVVDLSRHAFDREIGGTAVYGTVATGWRLR